MNAHDFLQRLAGAFPLNSNGRGFRGNHGITLGKEPGQLTVGVWWHNRLYPVTLDNEHLDLDEDAVRDVIRLVTIASTAQ